MKMELEELKGFQRFPADPKTNRSGQLIVFN